MDGHGDEQMGRESVKSGGAGRGQEYAEGDVRRRGQPRLGPPTTPVGN